MNFKKIILWYLFLFLFSFFCFRFFWFFYNFSIYPYIIGSLPLIIFIILPLKIYPHFFEREFKNNVFMAIFLGIISGLLISVLFRLFSSDLYGFFQNNFLFGLFYWLFISFSQEMFFRAFLLKEIKRRYSLFLSLVINSFLFSLWHLNIPFSYIWLTLNGFLRVFIVSLIWGYLYLKTKNLLSCFISHFLVGILLSQF